MNNQLALLKGIAQMHTARIKCHVCEPTVITLTPKTGKANTKENFNNKEL